MSCPKNIKRWWIFKWEGLCDWKPSYIKASGFSGKYHVDYLCENCGAEDHDIFVESQKLIRQGFDGELLRRLSFTGFGKSPDSLRFTEVILNGLETKLVGTKIDYRDIAKKVTGNYNSVITVIWSWKDKSGHLVTGSLIDGEILSLKPDMIINAIVTDNA